MGLTKRWFDEVIERDRAATAIAVVELAEAGAAPRDEISLSRTDFRFTRQVDRLAALLAESGYTRKQIEAALWGWLTHSVNRLAESAGDCSYNHRAFRLPAPAFEHKHRCGKCGAEVTCVNRACFDAPEMAHEAHG